MAEKDIEEKKKERKAQKPTELALGYKLDEVASALQKEIRHGDEEAAVYWALILYRKTPQYAWKRTLIAAAEDIGLAAPEVVAQVCALAQAWKIAKEGAYYVSPHHLTMAVVLLSRAPKSVEIEDLQSYTLELIKRKVRREVPDFALDAHTEAGRARGANWASWYDSRHFTFRIPVNRYTKKLWGLCPSWFSTRVKELLDRIQPTPEKSGDSDS